MECLTATTAGAASRVRFRAAIDRGFDAGEGLEVTHLLRGWGEGASQWGGGVGVVWVWTEGGEERREGGTVGLARRGGYLRGVVSYGNGLIPYIEGVQELCPGCLPRSLTQQRR